jgi:hypothetical protein
MLAIRMVLAIYVINLGYLFEGTGTRLDAYRFVSATLAGRHGVDDGSPAVGNRFAGTWLGNLPVPLPKSYVSGIDMQKRDFEDYAQPSYLGGEFSSRGWWYYYLYALAIKVPLGTWLLLALSTIAGRWASIDARLQDQFILLCPAVVILVFVSSQTGFSEHMRYVLPAFPFFFVWISRVVAVFGSRRRVLRWTTISALTWSIVSSLWLYPHSLSYFNELTGGPMGGPAHLISSNVDWGQDLLFLRRWLDHHPDAKPLKMAYFGYFDPKYAGITYTAPNELRDEDSEATKGTHEGWYAVSANFVRGYPYFTYRGDGTKCHVAQNTFARFQHQRPVAMAGYSIYIFNTRTDRSEGESE